MYRLLLLGSGKVGRMIAALLSHADDFEVIAGDVDEGALARLDDLPRVKRLRVDVGDPEKLRGALEGCRSVVSACPFHVNTGIARAARSAGVSYFDLTEDVATTHAIQAIAEDARPGQVFMPQCGLAPGFVGILGYHLTHGFDRLDEVRLRVGALSLFPTNGLQYNLTWSTDGLINEYCNPCEVVRDRRRAEAWPLEGLEHFSLDGIGYEAFNTSGGIGTLWQTLEGKARNVDYKTIRYPGHRDLVWFLINELRLGDRRSLLKDILEHAVPITLQDVVLIFCTVAGSKDGYLTQVSDARKIYHAELFGEKWSAIQITTAAALCAVVDLHREGVLPERGFVCQEQVPLETFLKNRFGRHYDAPVRNNVPAAKGGEVR